MESKIYSTLKNKYQSEYSFHFMRVKEMLRRPDEEVILEINELLNDMALLKMKIDILESAAIMTRKDQTLLFG